MTGGRRLSRTDLPRPDARKNRTCASGFKQIATVWFRPLASIPWQEPRSVVSFCKSGGSGRVLFCRQEPCPVDKGRVNISAKDSRCTWRYACIA